MTGELRLHSRVLDTRQLLADGREKSRKQHEAGSPGIQLGVYLSELLDEAVLGVFDAAVEGLGLSTDVDQSGVALVAHGGYGRRDVAPFSDVDVMVLYHPQAAPLIPDLASRLLQDLCDVGLSTGFSVRTVREAMQLAWKDAVIFTSLAESRFLAGNEMLFHRFYERFRAKAINMPRKLIRAIESSRRSERRTYGETVYMLEPNVKHSRGGLRDIQMLRWVGFARYGEADPANLRQLGVLSDEDRNSIRDALEYLLRLRNDLHFAAGGAQDVLSKPEQLRLAECYGFVGDEGVLPVERFMQKYFHHTTEVRNVVANFVAAAKWGSPLRMTVHNLLGKTFDNDYVVGPRYVSAKKSGKARVQGNLVEVLRLMDLSNRFNKRIDHELWQIIRKSMTKEIVEDVSREATTLFLSLLSEPVRLGRLLRRLHDLRALEKLIPGFDHARCLLQFNEYHKYTVDEHSLQAVERATEFAQDDGVLGHVYRNIKQKSTLHLALLIHDIGKGYAEDHSEVGKRIAARVADHLHLPREEADRLVFLVHRHLMLNHLAFRRDNSDQSILLEVASEIGSPENLQMLFVLSCADLAAVGPGVFNQWKLQVLSDLYEQIMETLSGSLDTDFDARLEPIRAQLLKQAGTKDDPAWIARQIEVLPLAYLRAANAKSIIEDLERLRGLHANRAVAWGRYLPDRQIAEYSVGAREDICDGIFHRLTGAITSKRLEILSAEIHSLADSLFLDKFYVQDPDYHGEPPQNRFDEVADALVGSLHGDVHDPPTFRRTWPSQRESGSLMALPTRVRIDNATSDSCTILDVFAHDRPGLLYAITKTIFEQRLSVRMAKIGTYLDQVVDVFYLTDLQGKKIEDGPRLDEIRACLLAAIEVWTEDNSAPFAQD